ncbi:MAG: flagellar basal body-associated FliL family protein [Steroidobacteraceae bacterium]
MSEAAAAEAKPARKKKLLLVGIAVGLLLGGGAGAFFMLKGGKKEGGEEAKAAAEHKLPAQFVALDPPFVVNFEAGSPARFLQIAVQLMTRDPHMVEFLKAHDPIIRNDLLLLFGNKTVADVSTQEAKEGLRQAALEKIRAIVTAEGEKPAALEAVYFTSFVMQ